MFQFRSAKLISKLNDTLVLQFLLIKSRFMKRVSISLVIMVLLCALLLPASNANSIVSYIVQIEEQARQDFLELTITTSASDKSLETAIRLARSKAEKLKELEEDVCRRLIKDKAECKGSVEIGNVKIKPKYESVKKETILKSITAEFNILVKIQHVQKFGELVDEILKLEGIVIEKIEWIPHPDEEQDHFLAESLDKSRELCAQLKQKLVRIVKVEELKDKPQKPEEEQPKEEEEEQEEEEQEQPEEQPEEEEQEKTKYRITVECGGKNQDKNAKPK